MKNVLLFMLMTFSVVANAQFIIWEDDFEDGEVSDWTLLDQDNNANTWLARKNIQYDNSTFLIYDGQFGVLGTYSINLTDGGPLFGREENIAISPAIDFSSYSGKITLHINGQTSIYDTNQPLSVYGSTSPDPATFTLLGEINFIRLTAEDAEFADYSLDISAFATGKTAMHIALGNTNNLFTGLEIDHISVEADSFLSVKDVESKTATTLKQNPVGESLELQLGDGISAEDVQLKIYNTTGVFLKEAQYAETGIPVSDLAIGVYFVVIENGIAVERLKFIKK